MFRRKASGIDLVVISDTHLRHEDLPPLRGDVLIHCGDLLDLFARNPGDLDRVDGWFARQAFDRILYTGGNHDFELEARLQTAHQPLRHAHFLCDSGLSYRGLQFWGAPWVPDLETHAFFAEPETLAAKWQAIPQDTDVLITHTPPAGILDQSSRGLRLGCPDLARQVAQIAPRLHVFGHVHASAGVLRQGSTTFVNASSVNSQFEIAHPPYRARLEVPQSQT